MRASLLMLLLPALALASPAPAPTTTTAAPNQNFCRVETSIISRLKKEAAATKFCSSFLHITTTTIYSTSTVIPDQFTKTKVVTVTGTPITRPQTKQSTVVVVTTPTVTETVTSTEDDTPTYIRTCLYGGSSAQLAARATANPISRPTAFTGKPQSSFISKACSCLSIPTPRTTTQVFATLPRMTIESTLPVTTNPVLRPTITQSTTTTRTASATTVTVTQVTTILNPPAFDYIPIGVRYSAYQHSFNDGPTGGGFNAQYFKSLTAFQQSVIPNMDFASSTTSPYELDLDDYYRPPIENSTYIALVMQGYYLANQTGTHTFASSRSLTDDWAYVWVGDVAYGGWTDDNVSFKTARVGPDAAASIPNSYSAHFTAGDQIPLTYLWANGKGPGRSNLQITTPDGKTTADTSNLFIPPCQQGSFP